MSKKKNENAVDLGAMSNAEFMNHIAKEVVSGGRSPTQQELFEVGKRGAIYVLGLTERQTSALERIADASERVADALEDQTYGDEDGADDEEKPDEEKDEEEKPEEQDEEESE